MKITYVGDSHGRWKELRKIIRKYEDSDLIISVGDVGFGFHPKDIKRQFPKNFKFIRGNHDDPAICRAKPNYLGDTSHFCYGPTISDIAFCISGAESIDRHLRTENVDWWADEQLSISQLQDAIDWAVKWKPRMIISHDAPLSLYNNLTKGKFEANGDKASRTANALQILFEQMQPELWIFGHFHNSFDEVINGTRFKCLAELETFTLEIK